MGGWRGAAASLANLDAGRIPWSQQRKCAHCGQVAMRGRRVCVLHGGSVGVARPGPDRVLARMLDSMAIAGLLPSALVQLDLWQALARRRMTVRARAQMALVLAWATRDHDPGRWSSAWRAATRAVRDHAEKS